MYHGTELSVDRQGVGYGSYRPEVQSDTKEEGGVRAKAVYRKAVNVQMPNGPYLVQSGARDFVTVNELWKLVCRKRSNKSPYGSCRM